MKKFDSVFGWIVALLLPVVLAVISIMFCVGAYKGEIFEESVLLAMVVCATVLVIVYIICFTVIIVKKNKNEREEKVAKIQLAQSESANMAKINYQKLQKVVYTTELDGEKITQNIEKF